MKSIILYLWQLPQNILAIILGIFWKEEKSLMYKGVKVIVNSKFPGGISLGNYVFVHRFPSKPESWNTVKHEWGHTRQSRIFGPLYLLIIGLPSILWAATWSPKSECSYYSFWTEKWADKLGGVDR